MNFNQAKIISVYYNKGDRKPYDVNGKPIAYIGEEFIGSTEATTIRFYLGEDIDSSTATIVTKRADGERRLDICSKVGSGATSYYEVTLNEWYSAVKGKLVVVFKAYNGTVTFDDNENPTEILSVSGRIVVSDIFNLDIAYAPVADLVVPPDATEPYEDWFFALSTKLDKADSITVAGALPTLTGDAYDDRYFYIEDEGVGRLYYINGSTAEEVIFGVGTLKLTPSGNGEVSADTGKVVFNQPNGTFRFGLYNSQYTYLNQDMLYYGKASGAITKGQAIQFAGVQGDHFLIKPAVPSEINANPELIMGVAKQDISNNEFGYVTSFGKIEDFNTDGKTVGQYLWFASGGSTAGAITTTQPTAPNAKVLLGVVVKEETSGAANNGVILVRVTFEPTLEQLQNVYVTSIADNQILRWNSANSRWENSSELTTAETNISEILSGDQIVGKATNDKDGNAIDTTYLKVATATSTYVPLSSKGVANGVAPLGSDNKIPSIHLPGGVDDIKEFADLASFPLVGEASIIYVALDTNKIYRWGGSAYVEISSSLALGTTNTTAFPGDRGLALETLTDNIVDGSQSLFRTTITNLSTTHRPLTINAITGTTANLQEWQVNGTTVGRVYSDGIFGISNIRNLSSLSNSRIEMENAYTRISRNIADANPSLIVNQANASSTGDILRLQFAGANKLEITKDGFINQNGTRLFHQTAGTTNTFFGNASGNLTLTGTNNTGFGDRALNVLTSGGANTGVGFVSLFSLTTGGNNTAVGLSSGRTITSGSNNTFIGVSSGFNASQLATATNSTALGFEAYTDKSNQMVFGNSSVSEFVFNRNTSANVLMPQTTISSGSQSSVTRTVTQTNNIQAPFFLLLETSGDMVDGFGVSQNFVIKDNASQRTIANIGARRSGADDSGRFVFETANSNVMTEKMTIMPDGKVGIGTSSPTQTLQVAGNIRLTDTLLFGGTNAYPRLRRSSNDLIFDTNTTTDVVTLKDGGLLGVGETSPSAQLQVKSGATNRIPLVVDTLASHTASLQEWRVNGSALAYVASNGVFRTGVGLANNVVYNNSNILLETTGTTIRRNIADTNPALIVNLANSSATGNIQVWQFGGSAVASLNRFGGFAGTSLNALSGSNNSRIDLGSTGTTISRNVADANTALIVNQNNSSSTGKIVSFQFNGVEKSYIDKDGNFSGASVIPTYTLLGSRTTDGTLTVTDIDGFDEIQIRVELYVNSDEVIWGVSKLPVADLTYANAGQDREGVGAVCIDDSGTIASAYVFRNNTDGTQLDIKLRNATNVKIYGINY